MQDDFKKNITPEKNTPKERKKNKGVYINTFVKHYQKKKHAADVFAEKNYELSIDLN